MNRIDELEKFALGLGAQINRLEKKIESLKCCGNCEWFEYDNRTGIHCWCSGNEKTAEQIGVDEVKNACPKWEKRKP